MADEKMTEAELPLETAGARLARAREAAGISRAQLSGITKIPERHLIAIESGNFAALAARAYAVGFSRSYARAVKLDEAAIAAQVRAELAAHEPEVRRTLPAFEPGDPARLPNRRLAWLAALAALVVVIGGFAIWGSQYLPGGSLPSLIQDEPLVVSKPVAAVPAPVATANPGPVVFTALEADVWVKFYDAAGAQLMQKQMTLGETYTIPGDMLGVQLWTARPQALAITIGGQPVAKLSEVQRTMKDVAVSAAALLARPAPGAIISSAPVTTASSSQQQRQRTALRQGGQRAAPSEPAPEASIAPAPASEAAPVPAATPPADR